ncbi:MAG: UbiA family prenyltransferase [Myxococcota bacterium]
MTETLRAWWLLSRPKLAPFVMLLPFLGWAYAHWDRALPTQHPGAFLAVASAWWWLHAGTLWLNAAVDRDEGEVLMGEAVPPPPFTAALGYAGLATSVAIAAFANPISGLAAALCAVLAVLYSHPATLWKAHPIGGPFVNWFGYGILSPLAGWAVADVALNPRTVVLWALGSFGVLGAYFAAQAFQGEEDRARGYRTLVVTHGPRTTLLAARACLAIGFVGGVALAAIGWIPRICLLAVGGWVLADRFFQQWLAQPDGGDESWARGFANRLLLALVLGVTLAFGQYVVDSLAGRPVAGLGTAGGHPPDRPRLPPAQMRFWDQARAHPR